MTEDEIYMQRCIQLARNGQNNVSPNPMVGAVIVCDGKIIGEGYHIRSGCAHAEVNAIHAVRNPSLLERSTLYVSLEPCSHYGKTPPCADLIVERKIPRIVIGCQDPFVSVSGRGIQKLREAGREVEVGVLEQECRNLIVRFITFHSLCRPYIILKWAESADGFIDVSRTGQKPVKLSTERTLMLVHKKRAEADAILIGTNTAALDNPSLNVRSWYGENPVRVVLDKHLVLNRSLHLFDQSIPTLVYTLKAYPDNEKIKYILLDGDKALLPQILHDLYRRNIQSLLVEGGSKLLQSFIDDELWDEAFIEKSIKQLSGGVKAPVISDKKSPLIEMNFGVYFRHFINKKP